MNKRSWAGNLGTIIKYLKFSIMNFSWGLREFRKSNIYLIIFSIYWCPLEVSDENKFQKKPLGILVIFLVMGHVCLSLHWEGGGWSPCDRSHGSPTTTWTCSNLYTPGPLYPPPLPPDLFKRVHLEIPAQPIGKRVVGLLLKNLLVSIWFLSITLCVRDYKGMRPPLYMITVQPVIIKQIRK